MNFIDRWKCIIFETLSAKIQIKIRKRSSEMLFLAFFSRILSHIQIKTFCVAFLQSSEAFIAKIKVKTKYSSLKIHILHSHIKSKSKYAIYLDPILHLLFKS